MTFGSVMGIFGTRLDEAMQVHDAAYREGLKTYFDRHLEAFKA